MQSTILLGTQRISCQNLKPDVQHFQSMLKLFHVSRKKKKNINKEFVLSYVWSHVVSISDDRQIPTWAAVEHCIGKYLRGSGIEDALVETGIFGLKVIELVFGGTHYVRSLRGLLIVSEALSIMQWEAFWSTKQLQ